MGKDKGKNPEVARREDNMKRYRVVLLEGIYNIVATLVVPPNVTIISRVKLWQRIVQWIQNRWRKPSSIRMKTYKPTTIIVAATNSSDEDKARANVICSGINDEQEIQAALDCHDGTIKVPGVSIT